MNTGHGGSKILYSPATARALRSLERSELSGWIQLSLQGRLPRALPCGLVPPTTAPVGQH